MVCRRHSKNHKVRRDMPQEDLSKLKIDQSVKKSVTGGRIKKPFVIAGLGDKKLARLVEGNRPDHPKPVQGTGPYHTLRDDRNNEKGRKTPRRQPVGVSGELKHESDPDHRQRGKTDKP